MSYSLINYLSLPTTAMNKENYFQMHKKDIFKKCITISNLIIDNCIDGIKTMMHLPTHNEEFNN